MSHLPKVLRHAWTCSTIEIDSRGVNTRSNTMILCSCAVYSFEWTGERCCSMVATGPRHRIVGHSLCSSSPQWRIVPGQNDTDCGSRRSWEWRRRTSCWEDDGGSTIGVWGDGGDRANVSHGGGESRTPDIYIISDPLPEPPAEFELAVWPSGNNTCRKWSANDLKSPRRHRNFESHHFGEGVIRSLCHETTASAQVRATLWQVNLADLVNCKRWQRHSTLPA